jgi:penicillin-binding protein 2
MAQGLRQFGRGGEADLEGPLRVLAFALMAVFAVFGLRLFQLQVVEGEELNLRSERNFVRTVRVEAPRGDILERDGGVLATTRPAFGVEVIPSELRRPELVFAVLGQLLDDDPQRLAETVGSPSGRRRFQPARIAKDLDFEHLARVETHRYALPGVFTDVRPRRDYVGGDLAAHVLGTLGEVTQEQLDTRAFAGYRPGEVVGKSGVEALLESSLRGRAGGRNVVVDVAGREVELLDEVRPVRGGTVVLTLDMDLQRAALEALREPGAEVAPAGAVVALDVRTGDVLALVSHPAYDPNDFAAGIDPETWERLRDDPWKPLSNRAVSGQYPPGSTYKAVVAAGSLQEGVITTRDRFYCPGHFRLGRRTYRCWKRAGHGWVNVHEALKLSCDVFFYNVGLRLGIDRMARYARGFGLGSATGAPFRQERAGLVPTSEWKKRRFQEPWMEGETLSAAIGQGFNLVTPLQLAVAFAALANGGKVLEPRLVTSRFDDHGALVEQPEVSVRGEVPVDPTHLAVVQEGLEAVVMEPGGTGGRARVPGLSVSGKTGTAQVVSLKHTEGLGDEIPVRYRDHAWFAAYAPSDAPEIVVVVLVEHGGGGGANAAPIAQKVLAQWWRERNPAVPAVPAELAALPEAGGE